MAVEGPAQGSKRGAKSVLIVEDNELNMKLFHDLLDAYGYRTIQTRNGLDASRSTAAERGNIDALRPAMDRVGPGIASLAEHLLRLDDLVNLSLRGVRLGVDYVDA